MTMWTTDWREQVWTQLDQTWDLVIIGGGITGAGILREASKLGLRGLLVEQRDFAWGTSSRSSKLVHGGLRYLKEGKLTLTRHAVQERQRLLKEAPGLVEPLGFLLPVYEGKTKTVEKTFYRAGLALYDLFAGQWEHRSYSAEALHMLAPQLSAVGLAGGFGYRDAQTDDARLVLRVLREGIRNGGSALNYVRAEALLWKEGRVAGVRLHDQVQQRTAEVYARVVMNATGAWADQLREQVGEQARLRPLRGSHLIVPAWRFPMPQAISFPHPEDRRPVFVLPWEGATLIGTTDQDHRPSLNEEPSIQPEEIDYLLTAINERFPDVGLTRVDLSATFSGVRPVIDTGKKKPSQESRDHAVWQEQGLLTITGGKLSTFRIMALDALRAIAAAQRPIPRTTGPGQDGRTGQEPAAEALSASVRRRLAGRYGIEARELIARAQPGELTTIPGACTLWAELRWAAHTEGVVHLEDLLLRRVRLGLVLPHGGAVHLPAIRAICQQELGWSDQRWAEEEQAYLHVVNTCYNIH